MLTTIAHANLRIAQGAPLIIAGSRGALAALNPGNWIGGSIPYFMTPEGGRCDTARVFVDDIRLPVTRWSIKSYAAAELGTLATDSFDNGFSYVIIPANSSAHLEYAMHAPGYPDIFLKPVIGWISGVHLDHLSTELPVVVDGRTGTVLEKDAIVMHVELPATLQVMVKTVNLFHPGRGPAIRFSEGGFGASTCLVDGKKTDLVRLMRDRNWDSRHPLVADYSGTHVNVSIKSVDAAANLVTFFAPVFPDVDYYEAAPVDDYVKTFDQLAKVGDHPVLSCNCILNYLYGKLEGRPTAPYTGPVTFGEIAHQLLNQTLVYLASSEIE